MGPLEDVDVAMALNHRHDRGERLRELVGEDVEEREVAEEHPARGPVQTRRAPPH